MPIESFEDNTSSSRVLLTHSCTAALEMAAILADIQAGPRDGPGKRRAGVRLCGGCCSVRGLHAGLCGGRDLCR